MNSVEHNEQPDSIEISNLSVLFSSAVDWIVPSVTIVSYVTTRRQWRCIELLLMSSVGRWWVTWSTNHLRWIGSHFVRPVCRWLWRRVVRLTIVIATTCIEETTSAHVLNTVLSLTCKIHIDKRYATLHVLRRMTGYNALHYTYCTEWQVTMHYLIHSL